MKRILLTGIALFVAATISNATQPPSLPLDISGITAVAIGGEASSLDITTAPDRPYLATLIRRRSGWFARWNSIWSYDDCSSSSRMWIEGTLLHIDVGSSTWFGVSDCSYDINLNVKKDAAIAIHQQALSARLTGQFSAVTIESKAADVALSGHAETISVNSDALRLGIVLDSPGTAQAVTVKARMLEADLDFSAVPELAYAVTAKASFVDTSRLSTPGAPVRLTIAGELVHATIR
ncbi:hypothetical protein [Rhizobium tumorigenes]|uniref:Auto-transporter adhesin head GIN domain-containing protein n=1 Tax=Rhizobium tumorigenes TaxID=2041385 RepID=A0AAF1KW00_9HYPH|nr:hypothetical protein [Rhizobium tumorigenes]WFR95484.1 hypothetical protein PR017_17255 [Rhizobium tumorigenes]